MTRSGLLLWLSKKDIRDGLQILDLYQLYRSVPFGVFDPFHLSTAIENHPAVAVAAEATPVSKVLHGTSTLIWSLFSLLHLITVAFQSLHIRTTSVRT